MEEHKYLQLQGERKTKILIGRKNSPIAIYKSFRGRTMQKKAIDVIVYILEYLFKGSGG